MTASRSVFTPHDRNGLFFESFIPMYRYLWEPDEMVKKFYLPVSKREEKKRKEKRKGKRKKEGRR